MTVTPNYVPRPFTAINVMLTVRNAHKALEFYNSAFGAEITMELKDANGVIVHAEMVIDDSVFMIAEESEHLPSPESTRGTAVTIHLYTGDCEGMFEDAVKAGAQIVQPITKHIYGDRSGMVMDPFGHRWVIATHEEDVTPRELQKRFIELNP